MKKYNMISIMHNGMRLSGLELQSFALFVFWSGFDLLSWLMLFCNCLVEYVRWVAGNPVKTSYLTCGAPHNCVIFGKTENKILSFGNWKIARRTRGVKGFNFLAGFLQVSNMFLKHLLKVCGKSLKSLLLVSNSNFTKSLSSPYLIPNKTLTSQDSSL